MSAGADLRGHVTQIPSFKDEEMKAKGSDIIVQESILIVAQTWLNDRVRNSRPSVSQSYSALAACCLLSSSKPRSIAVS